MFQINQFNFSVFFKSVYFYLFQFKMRGLKNMLAFICILSYVISLGMLIQNRREILENNLILFKDLPFSIVVIVTLNKINKRPIYVSVFFTKLYYTSRDKYYIIILITKFNQRKKVLFCIKHFIY